MQFFRNCALLIFIFCVIYSIFSVYSGGKFARISFVFSALYRAFCAIFALCASSAFLYNFGLPIFSFFRILRYIVLFTLVSCGYCALCCIYSSADSITLYILPIVFSSAVWFNTGVSRTRPHGPNRWTHPQHTPTPRGARERTHNVHCIEGRNGPAKQTVAVSLVGHGQAPKIKPPTRNVIKGRKNAQAIPRGQNFEKLHT